MNDRVDRCPACASARYTGARMGLVSCEDCGLVFSPAVWERLAADRLEQEWFGSDSCGEPSRWQVIFERLNNRRTLKRVARLAPAGRRFLEVGVGSGTLLATARARGFDVTGCDLSPDICRRVADTHGVPMVHGSVADVEGSALFDVIVANHVLEHVNDPLSFLGAARRLLARGGVAHVAVPNIGCPEAALPGWGSYEPYHLLYFTPATLSTLVAKCGLRVLSVSTRESFSGHFVAVSRTLLGVSVEQRRSWLAARAASRRFRPLDDLYRLAMVGLGGTLWPVRRVQDLLGHGDEIVCIAQKSSNDHQMVPR